MRIDSINFNSFQKTFVGLLDKLDKALGTLAKKTHYYATKIFINISSGNSFDKGVAGLKNAAHYNLQPDRLSEIFSKLFKL